MAQACARGRAAGRRLPRGGAVHADGRRRRPSSTSVSVSRTVRDGRVSGGASPGRPLRVRAVVQVHRALRGGGPVTFERPWSLAALLALPLLACSTSAPAASRAYAVSSRTWRSSVRSRGDGRGDADFRPRWSCSRWRRCVGASPARTSGGQVPQDRATVVLVLDVSRSMEARDVKPTATRRGEAGDPALPRQRSRPLRVGMVVFAGVPQVASPPTTDHEQVSGSLDHLGNYATFGGTAIGDALSMAVDVGRRRSSATGQRPRDRAGRRRRRGEEPRLDPLPLRRRAARGRAPAARGRTACEGGVDARLHRRARNAERHRPAAAAASSRSRRDRIPVPPDPVTLRAIAETTGGEFTEARDAESLDDAYEKLGPNLGREVRTWR